MGWMLFTSFVANDDIEMNGDLEMTDQPFLLDFDFD
jgi:hypothetical protein